MDVKLNIGAGNSVAVCSWPDAGFQRQTRTVSAPSPINMRPGLRRLPTSESRGQRHYFGSEHRPSVGKNKSFPVTFSRLRN